MWGIGSRMEKRLNDLGIKTIGDLAKCDDVYLLKSILGKNYIYYKDDDMYKTVIGITRDENNIDKIKSLYSDNVKIEEYYIASDLLDDKQNEYDEWIERC